MQKFDQSSAICRIFTYKEGILSYLAHDLRINVTSFTITVGGKDHFLEAYVDARSLRVDCAMENGRERPDLLSGRDRTDIDNNIIKDVLHTDKYPDSILLSSSVKKEGENYLVKADLTLAGRKQEISFEVRKEDGKRYVADVRLQPSGLRDHALQRTPGRYQDQAGYPGPYRNSDRQHFRGIVDVKKAVITHINCISWVKRPKTG